MPQLLVPFFTSIGLTGSIAGVSTALIAAQLTVGIGASLLSNALARKAAARSDTGVKLTVDFGDDLPLSLCVGDAITGGKRKYIGSWGKNSRYITEVIEYSSVPQGLAGFWVNEERGIIDWDAPVEYAPADSGRHLLGIPADNLQDEGKRIHVRVIPGTQTTADATLVDIFGSDPDYPWTSSAIGKGKSYVIVTTRYDSDTLTSYPAYAWEPEPLALYDLRQDTTAGGSGSQRWDNPATWQPTRNPAVIAYNICRGMYYGSEWIMGGRNLPAWRLPAADWIAAANACDELVDDGDGGTEPAYRVGLELTADATAADMLEEIGLAANMRFIPSGGRLRPVVGVPSASVLSITDDDIVITEQQTFAPFAAMTDTYNALSATYPEPAEKWVSKDAPEYIDADATAADGGQYRPTSLTYTAAPYAAQVQRLMRSQMKEYRRERRHEMHLPPGCYSLEPGDVVSWTSARNGYSAKRMMIEAVSKTPAMLVLVQLREVDPADYDPPETYAPVIVTTPVVFVPAPQAIAGFAASAVVLQDAGATDRRPAIAVSCDGGEVGVTQIRVQMRLSGSADVERDVLLPYDAPYSWTLQPVLPATSYDVRAQLLSNIAPVSVWSDWVTVTTDAVYIGLPDLDPGLADDLAALQDWIDGGVTDLPEALAAQAQAITDETAARIAAARALAEQWRGQVDTARALAAEVAELAAADHAAREQLRQSLSATLGDMRATYDLAITALADEGLAAVTRIETLEAGSDDLSALIQTTQAAIVEGDEALALLIATLSVGSALAFDHAAIWYFDSAVEGWTGSPSAPSVASGWLRPGNSSTADSPSGLAVPGGSYAQVRARLRKVGAPTWTGHLQWAGVSESFTTGRRISIAEPAWDVDGVAVVTFNPAWTGSIDRIRFDLVSGADGSNYVEIDWAAIGRPAPGASSADITAERQARIDGDIAIASDLVALEARVDDAETDLTGQAGAISALDTRVEATEDGLTAAAGRLDVVETEIADPATGLTALSDAIDLLASTVEATESGAIVAQAQALRAVESAIRAVAAEGIEGAARAATAQGAIRDYIATAAQDLNTRVDLTDDQVEIIAQAVTLLQAAIPGLATADALQALTATVTAQGGTITSQGEAITALTSIVNDPTSGLATKLAASVIANYYTKAETDGIAATAASSATTALQSSMEGPGGSVTAAQAAAQAASNLAGSKGKVLVQSTTPATEDRLAQNLWIDTTAGANTPKRWNGSAWVAVTDKVATDAAAAAASALAQVATKAEASALSALTTRVTTAEGTITSHSSQITSLSSSLSTTNSNVSAAQAAAQAASDLAGSKGKVLVQSTTPATEDRLAQNLWIDTTAGANTPKRWNGSAWVAVTDKVAVDAAAAAASALAQVATKAEATVVSDLSTLVSTQGNTLTSIANALTKLGATVGPSTAETIFRMTAEATPAGALARIGLKAAATGSEGDARVAALFLDALAGDQSRVVVQGDAFHVLIGSSTVPVFTVTGGVIRLASSLIRLDGDVVVTGAFQVGTLNIQNEAVSVTRTYTTGISYYYQTTWGDVATWSVTVPHATTYIIDIGILMTADIQAGDSLGLQIAVDGTPLIQNEVFGWAAAAHNSIRVAVSLATGTRQIKLRARMDGWGAVGGNRGITLASLYVFGAAR